MGQSSEPGLLFGTSQNAKSTKQASEVSQLQQSNAFCRSLIFYGVYCRHYFRNFWSFGFWKAIHMETFAKFTEL